MKLLIIKGIDNMDIIIFYLEEYNNILLFKIGVELIIFIGRL